MEIVNNLNLFFNKELEILDCDAHTRAYISATLGKFKHAYNDLSKDSITLIYAQAKYRQDFNSFQNIGDWLLYCNVFYPEHLNGASYEYYCSIGRFSYYACYRLLNKQWCVYERIADDFVPLSISARNIILQL